MDLDIAKEIEERIKKGICLTSVEVINESHLHAGHVGDNGTGQTHFKLVVASPEFKGVTRVKAHKIVNRLLEDLFSQGLHALSIETIGN